MDSRWLIGGLTVPAIMSLGLLIYALVLGRAPELQGAVVEVRRPESGAIAAFSGGETALRNDAEYVRHPSNPDRHPAVPSISGVFVHTSLAASERNRLLGGLSVPGEIDYRDPAEDGLVPLMPVWDRMDDSLSRHFRVRDFAARDGAPFARVSPELVALLDSLRNVLGSDVHINSAYRHPTLNFNAHIDGAVESRHMAGLAADIWVDGMTPFEVAEAALAVRGCGIGVGLGAGYIHVDLRDYTSSWTYEGAEMAEADFDLWMLERCADSFGEHARMLAAQPTCPEPLTGLDAAEAYREEMTTLARLQRERRVPGAVLLDVREDVLNKDDVSSRLAFLPTDSPLSRLMKLHRIVQRAEQNENFVFVVVDRDGAHRTGLMRYDGGDGPALDTPLNDRCG